MPEMTETQTPGRKPKKKKNKETHNAVERHRKEKINAGINRIGNLLPCSPVFKQSKNMILDQAFRYITELQKQNDTMLLKGGDRVQAEEICRLRSQLEDLRKESAHYIALLKAHDINFLEDPTIHWTGKQRCAKVAPTNQLPKRIFVYSNGDAMCPAGKQNNPGKQTSETLILQPAAEPRLRVNGALLQVNSLSSTPGLLPGSAVTPAHSAPGLQMIEQCVVETLTSAPTLPPSVSYITLQIPATTTMPQQTPPAAPQTVTLVTTSASQPSTKASPETAQPAFPQTVTRAATSEVSSRIAPDNAIRTLNYTAVASSPTPLRAGAAGSTQTTWTTLQMAGNTVQPVCQSLPSQEANATQTVQQVTMCPMGSKSSAHPIQIQMQPHVPVQETSITAQIQTNQVQNPPQSAVLNHSQPPSILTGQAQCAVVTHPPAALLAQPPTLPQPPLVPQPQAAVLPVLQTMQVLQVNPTGAAASSVTACQKTNNPSVVILQQASPAQSVVREDMSNQAPCQHIVIIQAPNQAAPAPQNPQVGVVPAAVAAASTQTPTTGSPLPPPALQSVGGKQLVHILPRPVRPQANHSQQGSQGSASPPGPTTPQTITVNGQVFALQPLKTSDKTSSQGGQGTLQLVQPTTTEEPTTNVALNSLGALSSLNQSISQGLPLAISSQNNFKAPPVPLTILQPKQQQSPPPQQPPGPNPIPSAPVAPKTTGRRPRAASNEKRTITKRTKPAKKKEPNPGQTASPAKSEAAEKESRPVQVKVAEVSQPSTICPTCTTVSTTTESRVVVGTHQTTARSATASTRPQTPITVSQGDPVSGHSSASAITTTVTTVNATSVTSACSASERDKTADAPGTSPSASKLSVPENKRPASFTPISTASGSAYTTAASKQTMSAESSSPAAESQKSSAADCSSRSTRGVPEPSNPTPHADCARPKTKDPSPYDKFQSQSLTSSSVSTSSAATVHSSVPDATGNSELRKGDSTPKAAAQQAEVPAANHLSCHPVEVKPSQATTEVQEERRMAASEKEAFVAVVSNETPRKDFALPQQVYTNLDEQPADPPSSSGRQTDSPMCTGGGRGFSVASLLPQGHGICTSSTSFGTFTFTSEQAEMLALAMLEQDSPGKRSEVCPGENPSSSNPPAVAWDSNKPLLASPSKDRVSAGQPAKGNNKPPEAGTGKVVSEIRSQAAQGSVAGTNGTRHPQNLAYTQSQTHPHAQSQSASQSGTAASLSVNNLIRPSSSHQVYPGSPNLTGQQGSAPSPAGASAHISQASNTAPSPCSGTAQANEYAPLKAPLMRAQPGVGAAERQVKMASKRQAPEEVMLGKRPKPCHPANAVGHMEVKAPDCSQILATQLTATSSAVMGRINPEGSATLFSANAFMSASVRPSEGQCPGQQAPEQNQIGALHLAQAHPQHAVNQPNPHLGGNLYMKQQQEQQRHHLYHLQHHLTQSDPAQRHSLHQRALQQQEHQHVQKKRGLVRGSQSGSPAGLPQKQHHMEKPGLQQHSHQQQHQQRAQPHQQPTQHQQQSHPQQHPQVHPQPAQHPHQQQQLQQQNSRSIHQQHLQQQIQQQHFRHQEKSCEAQSAASRGHHGNHLNQQDHLKPGQDHNAMQRMLNSRNLDQQLISPPSNPASRSSELACASSRQRVSSYSAEALIGKSSSSGERMILHLQPGRGGSQEQVDLRGYLDASRGKTGIPHNSQNRLPSDHTADVQRVSECTPFKSMGGVAGSHQLGGFEAQVSRGSDMAAKAVPPSQRGPQGQQQGGFRMSVGPSADGRNRGGYSGGHTGPQGVQVAPAMAREQEGCQQSFMQSLLSPHLPEQSGHQRAVQCCPPVSMEYSCVPGSSSADLQAKASSPSVPQSQKPPAMRLAEGNKTHISQVGGNMHGGPGARAGLPHPPPPHSSAEQARPAAPPRPPAAVSQHSRHIPRDTQNSKLRPGERPRSGTLRPTNPFEPEGHLPLPTGGGVLLGRPQPGGEARRSTIVRFMAEGAPVSGDNNLVSDQHLAQNFGFPFISEGGMNPPPSINANSTFIPPVSQANTARTPALLPVEPQSTLPSFYPSYSPAAHPSLPSDVTLQYFPNQMFTSPSADKASGPPLNNRFGSILSPPRPVGFGVERGFPLLPDMPPMPITNSSGITPHISNFSLTSLFPEIATGMPGDGSAMPMSPLLSLSNASSSDSSKQPNRPAHNISHILGHDGSSAV